MTSSSTVGSLVAELRFAGTAPPEGVRPRWTLDFESPLAWPDLPYDSAAAASRHPPSRREPLAAVLDDAVATLAGRLPAAAGFIVAQLDRVLLRCDAGAAGASSGSHRSHVGACVLTNLDAPDDPRSIAVEALLHEAIHQHLYRLESREGLFCDLAETPRFRSPWTGARLPLHSLVHAALVWFGLANLWAALGARPANDAEAARARGRAAHCLFGHAFLEDLLGSPGFPRERVRPEVLAALRDAAATLQRAVDRAERVPTLARLATLRASPEWLPRLHAALTEEDGPPAR